jgi:phosphatidylserine decarboxylase
MAAKGKVHRKCRIASEGQKNYFERVKHSGKAANSAFVLIGYSGLGVLALLGAAYIGKYLGPWILGMTGFLVFLWALFVVFTFYFFRDPDPITPEAPNLVVAPGHGKVDTIDTTTVEDFIGGECQRISIFLSVFDVHVQNSPITGRVGFFRHKPGQYLNAMRTDCADFNENVLIGFESVEKPGTKVGVRLIAGLIARRIVPWVTENDAVQRGERISLIQFGSRVNVYLPLTAKIKVKLGDRVIGGNTVLAELV